MAGERSVAASAATDQPLGGGGIVHCSRLLRISTAPLSREHHPGISEVARNCGCLRGYAKQCGVMPISTAIRRATFPENLATIAAMLASGALEANVMSATTSAATDSTR